LPRAYALHPLSAGRPNWRLPGMPLQQQACIYQRRPWLLLHLSTPAYAGASPPLHSSAAPHYTHCPYLTWHTLPCLVHDTCHATPFLFMHTAAPLFVHMAIPFCPAFSGVAFLAHIFTTLTFTTGHTTFPHTHTFAFCPQLPHTATGPPYTGTSHSPLPHLPALLRPLWPKCHHPPPPQYALPSPSTNVQPVHGPWNSIS